MPSRTVSDDERLAKNIKVRKFHCEALEPRRPAQTGARQNRQIRFQAGDSGVPLRIARQHFHDRHLQRHRIAPPRSIRITGTLDTCQFIPIVICCCSLDDRTASHNPLPIVIPADACRMILGARHDFEPIKMARRSGPSLLSHGAVLFPLLADLRRIIGLARRVITAPS